MSKSRKYLWATADFEAMCEYWSGIDWMQLIYTNPSGSCIWAELIRLLQFAVDAFVPSVVVPVSSKQ